MGICFEDFFYRLQKFRGFFLRENESGFRSRIEAGYMSYAATYSRLAWSLVLMEDSVTQFGYR